MKNYYKSDKHVKFWEDYVIEKYIAGIFLDKNVYGQRVEKPISKGPVGKVNTALDLRARKLSSSYNKLLSIEMTVLRIVENEATNPYGIATNLRRIIKPQSETVKFLCALRDGLKQYPIKEKKIYAAIIKNLDSAEERCGRNASFLDVFIADCGLQPLVDAVKEETGETMYDFAARITADWYTRNNWGKGMTKEDIYEGKCNALYEVIMEIAEKHKIILKDLISDKEVEKAEKRKAVQKKISEQKKKFRKEDLQMKAASVFATQSSVIQRAIDNGNSKRDIGQPAYLKTINVLRFFGGAACYIAVLKSTKPYYLKDNGELTTSVVNAIWFASRTDENAQKMLSAAKETYPNAVCDLVQVIAPDLLQANAVPKEQKVISKDDISAAMSRDARNMVKLFENYDFIDCESIYRVEEMSIRNAEKLYYVYAFHPGCMETGFLSAEGTVTNAIRHIQIFDMFEQAEAMAKKMDGVEGYSLYPNRIQLSGRYPIHDQCEEMANRVFKVVEAEFKNASKYVNDAFCHTGYQYSTSSITYNRLRRLIEDNNGIYIIWYVKILKGDGGKNFGFITFAGNTHQTSISELFYDDILVDRVRYNSELKGTIGYAKSGDKEGLDMLRQLKRDLKGKAISDGKAWHMEICKLLIDEDKNVKIEKVD